MSSAPPTVVADRSGSGAIIFPTRRPVFSLEADRLNQFPPKERARRRGAAATNAADVPRMQRSSTFPELLRWTPPSGPRPAERTEVYRQVLEKGGAAAEAHTPAEHIHCRCQQNASFSHFPLAPPWAKPEGGWGEGGGQVKGWHRRAGANKGSCFSNLLHEKLFDKFHNPYLSLSLSVCLSLTHANIMTTKLNV